ncbi:hypothetical protein C3L33_04387, partial [Rhododendron williamsianum]
MEARRRLALLSSHLRPTTTGSPTSPFRLRIALRLRFVKRLYEDDVCLCILDTNPVSRGHSLIIPKSHFPCLQATPPPVIGAMCSKVPFISNAVVKATGCDSYNLLVNNGAAAGQVIFHTHLHIIPRKARDCLWASEVSTICFHFLFHLMENKQPCPGRSKGLKFLQSLPRHPLKLDHETSQLADRIRKELLFFNSSKDDEGQGSTLSTN